MTYISVDLITVHVCQCSSEQKNKVGNGWRRQVSYLYIIGILKENLKKQKQTTKLKCKCTLARSNGNGLFTVQNFLHRLRRASWFNPRLRRYAIKERPKSWVYGNYRKTIQEENGPATGVHKQKPVPPPPPVRSPLTRLQSDPSIIVPAGDKEDKDSEKGLQNKIMNESNRSDKCDVNNTNETGNDPNQEKDFTVEI